MKVKILISFLVVYLIWGSTFAAIKIGLDSFPPITLAGIRFMFAGLIFLTLSKLSDLKKLTKLDVKNEVIVGLLFNCSNAGVCWSTRYTSTTVAALLVGAIPLLFILFNWISFEKKVPHLSSLIAIGVGLIGIGLISTDNKSISDWRAIGALLISNCLWVAGSLRFKANKTSLPYHPRAALQLLAGGFFLVLFSRVLNEEFTWEAVKTSGVYSVLYLSIFGTVIAYTAYSFLLKNVRTELTSTYALANPVVALLIGIAIFGEAFSLNVVISCGLILFSVFLTLYGEKMMNRYVLVPALIPVRNREKIRERLE